MGIVSVHEINPGRSGEKDRENNRRYVRVFGVEVDDVKTTAVQVRDAADLPSFGDFLDDLNGGLVDNGVAVVEKTAQPPTEDNPYWWTVTVVYDRQGSPLTQHWEVNWGFARFQKAITKDVNGNAIVNSAGDPFDPPIEVDDDRPQLTITRYESSYSPTTAKTYKDAVNSDVVTIDGVTFPAYTLKITSIAAQRVAVNGTWYWRVTYTIEYRPETWRLQILDRGYRKKVVGGTQVQMFDASSGVPHSAPKLLDGSGGDLAAGAAPVFITADVFNPVAFAGLNLDYSANSP